MTNKTALITGASAGIGYELSQVFAENGYDLILVARREKKLNALAEQLSVKFAIKVHVIAQDLMAPQAATSLYNKVQDQALTVDVLVNNAGRGHYQPFIKAGLEDDEATLQLNIVTLTSLTKLFAAQMVKQGGGKILNIASIAAFIPGPMMAVYNASKAYVLSLSEAVNNELSGTGVTVTASCPGPTESEFMAHSGTDKLDNLKYTKFMTARKVAEQAFEAAIKGKPVVVHGGVNKAITIMPRFLPRSVVPSIIRRAMK